MAHDLTQRTIRIHNLAPNLDTAEVFAIAGEGEFPHAYAAVKMGNHFRAIAVERDDYDAHDGKTPEYQMVFDTQGVLYAPVDQSMTVEQVEGARYAHDDGTKWSFYACSPGEHHDFADEVEAFAATQLQPDINQAIIKRVEASNRTTRTAAERKLTALQSLAKAVCARVHATVLAQTLGYYHANPHTDHKRTLTREAIVAILATWEKGDADAKAMRTQVLADANKIVAKFTKVNTIKTPEQKRAEDAAAAKKAATTSQTAM